MDQKTINLYVCCLSKVPIYLAEYVLPHYGTGVVMGVPAHDSRDIEFAHHHDLEIRQVVEPAGAENSNKNAALQFEPSDVMSDYGILCDSGEFTGKTTEQAQTEINKKLADDGIGGPFTQFRLRDWLVSRQRYWGTPVPVIHCKSCGPVGVPPQDLPVELPALSDISDDLKGGDGESPLARMTDWKRCTCPQCGGAAERDTDTLDTFVDSSWYYMRYCDAQNKEELFATEHAAKWMKQKGADLYVGGIEHAILHLLYSRFITKFLFDQKMLPADEPFSQLLAQGMVLGRTYKSPGSLRCLKPSEYSVDVDGKVTESKTGHEVITVWEKMSKSKYNGVDPEVIRSQHGADVTRLVVLFKAPPAHELEWDESDLAGQSRWISRIWGLIDASIASSSSASTRSPSEPQAETELRLELHGTIKRVTEALDEHQSFNVAIAELMKLSNLLGDKKQLNDTSAYKESLASLVKMLAPLAPHTASEMFEHLQHSGLITYSEEAVSDVHESVWPQFDAVLLASAQVKIVLQVQGKARDTIFISPKIQGNQEQVLALAMASSAVQRHLQGKQVRKAILIPPKKQGAHGLLNIVAS